MATGGVVNSGSAGAAQVQLHNTRSQGNAAGEAFSGGLKIWGPSNASVNTSMQQDTVQASSDGFTQRSYGLGRSNFTTPVTSIRILMSTGNIASGEFYLYGMTKP